MVEQRCCRPLLTAAACTSPHPHAPSPPDFVVVGRRHRGAYPVLVLVCRRVGGRQVRRRPGVVPLLPLLEHAQQAGQEQVVAVDALPRLRDLGWGMLIVGM